MTYTMYTIETNPYEEIINFYNHDTGCVVDIFAETTTICNVYLYKKVCHSRTTRKHRIIMTKIANRLAGYKEVEDSNE